MNLLEHYFESSAGLIGNKRKYLAVPPPWGFVPPILFHSVQCTLSGSEAQAVAKTICVP